MENDVADQQENISDLREKNRLLEEQLRQYQKIETPSEPDPTPPFLETTLPEARDLDIWHRQSDYRKQYESLHPILQNITSFQKDYLAWDDASPECVTHWNSIVAGIRDEMEKLIAAEKSGLGLKVFNIAELSQNKFSNPEVQKAFNAGKKMDRVSKESKSKNPFRGGGVRHPHSNKTSANDYNQRSHPYSRHPPPPLTRRPDRSANGVGFNQCRRCKENGHWERDCPKKG